MLRTVRLLTAFSVVCLAAACGEGKIDQGLTQENCDNRLDDDRDGLVDCSDDDCSTAPACGNAQSAITGPEFDVCAESVGDRSQYPVDMIWLLDSSVSMQRELSWIANNLNDMDGFLREKRANVRVVMLGGPSVCVAPPLGGPDCTNGERFLHLPEDIGNQETLRKAVELYPRFKDFLRPGARRVFVAVSDDNPNPRLRPEGWPKGVTAATVRERLSALGAEFANPVFHSIVAFAEDGGRHPTGCAGAQRLGQTYLELTERTGGIKFSVCNNRQGEWRDFLDELATQVAGLVNVPCSYPRSLPLDSLPLHEGRATNAGQLYIEAEIDGRWKPLIQVPDAQTCTDQFGWYPSGENAQICPAVCSRLEVSQLRLKHGCPAGPPPD